MHTCVVGYNVSNRKKRVIAMEQSPKSPLDRKIAKITSRQIAEGMIDAEDMAREIALWAYEQVKIETLADDVRGKPYALGMTDGINIAAMRQKQNAKEAGIIE